MFCLNVELVASRNGDLNLLKRGLPLVAAWISLFFITAACRSPTRLGASSAGDPSQESRPKVLTTFTILADMARNVAGDRLQGPLRSPGQRFMVMNSRPAISSALPVPI